MTAALLAFIFTPHYYSFGSDKLEIFIGCLSVDLVRCAFFGDMGNSDFASPLQVFTKSIRAFPAYCFAPHEQSDKLSLTRLGNLHASDPH